MYCIFIDMLLIYLCCLSGRVIQITCTFYGNLKSITKGENNCQIWSFKFDEKFHMQTANNFSPKSMQQISLEASAQLVDAAIVSVSLIEYFPNFHITPFCGYCTFTALPKFECEILFQSQVR